MNPTVPTNPTMEVTTRRRQRGTREATRERLVQAAIDLIRQGGIGAVSTVSVTQAAGFAQSSFYMHFRNVEECLQAAAEKVAGEVRALTAAQRRQSYMQSPGAAMPDATAGTEYYKTVLNSFLQERQWAELLLRHRHDPSPLGRVLRELMEQIRADLVADVWQLAQWADIGEEHYQRIAVQSEFLLAMVLAAGEALLEGRLTDTDMVAAELAAATDAIGQGISARCRS